MFPSDLRQAIDVEVARCERSRVARAVEQLTTRYKEQSFTGALGSDEARLAYLITRVPATYAANERVFGEAKRLLPNLKIDSVLDLGAGPGTAMRAAKQAWPELSEITLLERDSGLIDLGRRLGSQADDEAIRQARWIHADFSSAELPTSDVVVLSYAIGELKTALPAVQKAWAAARKLMVIVEPGTPRNFARMADIRKEMLAGGASIFVLAPCPHDRGCPMLGDHDWCHFSVRLERTAEHRRMKSGSLGFEDEKFSYLIFSREPAKLPESRIVRHPLIRPGHIQLQLCTAEGLKKTTVTRSDKERFRAARKASWGDAWDQFE